VIVPDIKFVPSIEIEDNVLADKSGAEIFKVPEEVKFMELSLGTVAEEIII
tara:strand:- start:47 stop:199 length:153 start_codon:yes stop_codon:yes gene_type:complete